MFKKFRVAQDITTTGTGVSSKYSIFVEIVVSVSSTFLLSFCYVISFYFSRKSQYLNYRATS